MKNNKKLLLSLAISTALYGTAGFAAEVVDDEDDNVIIVTAQKRSERITEVPISMSVFSVESIEQTGIQELRDIAEYIPNVAITQGTDFNSRIMIRGVGAASRNIGFDSRVGVYLDGVYLGQGPAINQDLVDLEQVEVLRGPQGTLFGKNTVAGAISLISKKPHHDLEAKVTANISNLNGQEYIVSANIPMSDTLAASVSISSRKRDGYIKNVWQASDVPTNMVVGIGSTGPIFAPISAVIQGQFNPAFVAFGFGPHPTNGIGPTNAPKANQDLNNIDTFSWRTAFRFEPNDNLDVDLTFDGLHSDRFSVLGVASTDTFGAFKDIYAPKNDEVSVSNPGEERRDIFGSSLTFTYDMANDFTVKSITSYRETDLIYNNDTDDGPVDFVNLTYTDGYDQKTQEFQLISPDDSDFKYVIGAYYYQQDAKTDRDVFNGNGGFFFSDFANFSVNFPGTATSTVGTLDTESYAFFVSGSYQINEQWKLGFGVRYTSEDKTVNWNLFGGNSGLFGIATTPAEGFVDKRNDTNTAPTVSLSYAIDENSTFYGKFSTGFKSGGYNLDFVDRTALDAGIEFDKETVDSYEFGYKSQLLDNRLSLSIAYFDSQYDNYQVNQFFQLGVVGGIETTSIRITNAATVNTDGFEFEANFKVTDDFSINGSLGLLNATFGKFPGGASPRDPITGVAQLKADADGKDLPYAPDMSASLGLQYYSRVESLDADMLFRVDATYTGDYFTTIENVKTRGLNGNGPLTAALNIAQFGTVDKVDFGFVDGYVLLNARIGLIDGQGDWEVYLWGRNLTDEDQYVDSFRNFFGSLVNTPQTPRTYGIEASYNF